MTSAKHLDVQTGIVKQIRTSHDEGQASEQTLIREEMNTLASQVSADIAYADLQNAYANIYASMGIDPYADDLRADATIEQLADTLEQVWIERGDTSGASRAKRSAEAHLVTGSIEKPAEAAAGDPIVSQSKSVSGNASGYNPEIIHIENKKPSSFLSHVMNGGERNGPAARKIETR